MEAKPCPTPGCKGSLLQESYPGPDGKIIMKEVCTECQYGEPKED